MQLASPNNRIDAVDALRGFALAGIVFAHMLEQFLGASRPELAGGTERFRSYGDGFAWHIRDGEVFLHLRGAVWYELCHHDG